MPIIIKSQFDMQRDFMHAMGIPLGTPETVRMSHTLIKEEMVAELNAAMDKYYELLAREQTDDPSTWEETLDILTEVADACVDSVYVIYQLMNGLMLPFDTLFNEVHRSNMTKRTILPDGNSSILRREDGKVLKPETYEPPRLREIVQASIMERLQAMDNADARQSKEN